MSSVINQLQKIVIAAADAADVELGFIMPTEQSTTVQLFIDGEERIFRTAIRNASYETFFNNFKTLKNNSNDTNIH